MGCWVLIYLKNVFFFLLWHLMKSVWGWKSGLKLLSLLVLEVCFLCILGSGAAIWNSHATEMFTEILYFLSEHLLVIFFAPNILKFEVDIHCCGSIFIVCPRMDSVLTSTLLGWEFLCIIDLGFLPSMFSIFSFWNSYWSNLNVANRFSFHLYHLFHQSC